MKISNMAQLSPILIDRGFHNIFSVGKYLTRALSQDRGEIVVGLDQVRSWDGAQRDLLLFQRQGESDIYSFGEFQCTLRTTNDEDDDISRVFTVGPFGVTRPEAYNLLAGRWLFKQLLIDGENSYKGWIRLLLQETTGGDVPYPIISLGADWQYDLEAVLQSYNILDLEDEQMRSAMLFSLLQGNREIVTISKQGRKFRSVISASPDLGGLMIESFQTAIKNLFYDVSR